MSNEVRSTLAIIAGLIAIGATFPYLRDIVRRTTKPSIVTWFTWGSLSLIAGFAALSGHAYETAIFSFSLAIADYAIVIMGSIKDGVRHYTKLDIACQIVAIVGVLLWISTSQPVLAVLFVILADLIGAVPTYRHIWARPHEETLDTYMLSALSAVVVAISLASFSFINSGYPVYILASAMSFTGLIAWRRRTATVQKS